MSIYHGQKTCASRRVGRLPCVEVNAERRPVDDRTNGDGEPGDCGGYRIVVGMDGEGRVYEGDESGATSVFPRGVENCLCFGIGVRGVSVSTDT